MLVLLLMDLHSSFFDLLGDDLSALRRIVWRWISFKQEDQICPMKDKCCSVILVLGCDL